MVGKLLILVFGLVVCLKASTWQWRGLGLMFVVWGIAAIIGGAIAKRRARPWRITPPRPVPPAAAPDGKPKAKPGLATPGSAKPPAK